ncbi:hypothetical protein CBL_02874 [Carabus blaptoides fortunei]
MVDVAGVASLVIWKNLFPAWNQDKKNNIRFFIESLAQGLVYPQVIRRGQREIARPLANAIDLTKNLISSSDVGSSENSCSYPSKRKKRLSGIKPPDNLQTDSDKSTSWKKWLQQFEWYTTAIQLNNKPAEVQAATFMALISLDAIEIYNSFNLSDADKNNLHIIKDRFKEYFAPKTNISSEGYIFFKIEQNEDELFNEFLTRIKTQASKCEFGNLLNEMLKDKIVFGIKSYQVREKLLTEDNLDLTKATTICKTSEQASKQLDEIKMKQDTKLKNRVNAVEESSNSEDDLYLSAISTGGKKNWTEKIQIGNVKFTAKLDTGAECNVLPRYLMDKTKANLKPSRTRNLISYTEDKMAVKGEAELFCKLKSEEETSYQSSGRKSRTDPRT